MGQILLAIILISILVGVPFVAGMFTAYTTTLGAIGLFVGSLLFFVFMQHLIQSE